VLADDLVRDRAPVSGTSFMLRRAASTALRTASLTSFAFPVAMPT